MINGRLYDAATMNRIGNDPTPRSPLYWERELTNRVPSLVFRVAVILVYQ